jgi:hypothetical protein
MDDEARSFHNIQSQKLNNLGSLVFLEVKTDVDETDFRWKKLVHFSFILLLNKPTKYHDHPCQGHPSRLYQS